MSTPPEDKPIPQSDKCRICDERYSTEKYPVSLPCGHVICTECERGVSRASLSPLCPFCRRRYHSGDLRRIFNDAEERSAYQEMLDAAERVKKIVDKQKKDSTELSTLRKENSELKTEVERLKIQTGISQLSMTPGPSGCQNCAGLRAELKRLRLENRKLTEKNRLLASTKIEAEVSSDSDSD